MISAYLYVFLALQQEIDKIVQGFEKNDLGGDLCWGCKARETQEENERDAVEDV